MAFAKPAIAVITLGALASLAQSVIAQPSSGSEFVVVASHMDNVREQHSILQTGNDCANNTACMTVARIVSAATEIPFDKMMMAAAALARSSEGEGTFTTIGLPAGYAYCSSSSSIQSIVPRDGDRGSTFLGRADASGLYTETWTPVLPPFQGRSWVEGDITVVGVRSDLAQSYYASGKCHAPGRGVFYCRGSGCEGQMVDNGQSVDTSSPPGAGSRK